ncbi:unnamed protein product [Rotaria socialis]|uniref:Uncharacterized protein n=1 Tax=Rotaria socialis TaxID=392032 RepID=A0A817WEC2_9BILA|nr:unnamed protein product [Rotaria socialis]CAF4866667.1 unnamed protein product [Rotaria socialis]
MTEDFAGFDDFIVQEKKYKIKEVVTYCWSFNSESEVNVDDLLNSHDVPLTEEVIIDLNENNKFEEGEREEALSSPVTLISISVKEIEEGILLSEKLTQHLE